MIHLDIEGKTRLFSSFSFVEENRRREEERKSKKPVTAGKVALWAIALYTGKKLLDSFKSSKDKSKLEKVEKVIGRNGEFKLDNYSDNNDALLVESCILKFNEVLSSPQPKTVIGNNINEYENLYNACRDAIKRSSSDPEKDRNYLDAAWEFTQYKNFESDV